MVRANSLHILNLWTGQVDFDADPLTSDHAQIFPNKCLKSAKSNPIFYLKGRGDTVLPLAYLDCPMAEYLSVNMYFFRFRPFSGGKRGSKLDKNLQTLGISLSVKIWIFLKFFKHCVSLNTNSGKNFGKIWQYLGELGPKKLPKRAISWMLHCHKNIWKFITWQPLMPYWWNLPRLCIFMRPLVCQKIGA